LPGAADCQTDQNAESQSAKLEAGQSTGKSRFPPFCGDMLYEEELCAATTIITAKPIDWKNRWNPT
ncbi:MAG: hypothetical protein OXG67_13720, partial [bacterium]|nr:hypothetical protein [bacterium]